MAQTSQGKIIKKQLIDFFVHHQSTGTQLSEKTQEKEQKNANDNIIPIPKSTSESWLPSSQSPQKFPSIQSNISILL